MGPPPVVSVVGAAELLGVDPVTVRHMISQGKLRAVKAPYGQRKIFILKSSVDRLIESFKEAIQAAEEENENGE
jgi:excisionase family DNA binding protein